MLLHKQCTKSTEQCTYSHSHNDAGSRNLHRGHSTDDNRMNWLHWWLFRMLPPSDQTKVVAYGRWSLTRTLIQEALSHEAQTIRKLLPVRYMSKIINESLKSLFDILFFSPLYFKIVKEIVNCIILLTWLEFGNTLPYCTRTFACFSLQRVCTDKRIKYNISGHTFP